MHRAKKVFLLIWGLLETWVFSGSILGWTALHYMLKKQGIYQHLCHSVEVPSPTNDTLRFPDFGGGSTPEPSSATVQALSHQIGVGFWNRPQSKLGMDLAGTYTSGYLPDTNVHLSGGRNKDKLALTTHVGCVAQDKLLNLAYTIGIFCVGFSAFIWGFLIDKLGLRLIRLLLNGLITVGAILLSVTTKETSYLVFPSLTLMCLAGVPLRLANMQIANLFPSRRSTVITLYSGAFTASASIFIFTKYGYDAGLKWEWVCYILVTISCTMLPVTLFCLPVDRIRDDSEECEESIFKKVADIAIISTGAQGKFSKIPASPFSNRKSSDCLDGGSPLKDVVFTRGYPEKTESLVACDEQLPFRESLLSFSFTLHQYWFSWLLLATLNYAGSLNLWMERITSDLHTVSMYTQIYGLAQVSSLLLAPLAGLVLDYTVNVAAQEPDYEKRKLIKLRSGFWPMLFTTVAQAIVQVCKFFECEESIYVSIAFTTILRSFHVAVATAYLRIRFPASHFNRLIGIMSTTAAIITLLQFPLYVWESKSNDDVFNVNIFCGITLMLCFVHPLHLLITPLQRYFIRKERDVTLKRLKNSN